MNCLTPQAAEIVEKRRESENIFTFRLRFCAEEARRSFSFSPGQFNMIYAFGVGDVAITIVSDPDDMETLDHTIRTVGNVTQALGRLEKGDVVGLRGPFGSTWPLEEIRGKDVMILTGGLGCAPTLGALHYLIRRRESYGAIKIIHGIKAPRDLIYQKKFREWEKTPNTEVHLTVDKPARGWKHKIGLVTHLLKDVAFDAAKTVVMMCGPEIMMRLSLKELIYRGIAPERIYLALERNMKCALGFCGHCQFGPHFICKDGPILRYDRIREIFHLKEV
ncbi:MAG TPA: Ni/Fe hydrogenase subunit gamma [Deltaproteobacteria bacterium]|nr:Ni/Fe hydrogenase subunit gamma [Deltaproteobacteria bacterium]